MTVQGKAPPSRLSASKTDQARMVGWTCPVIFLVKNTPAGGVHGWSPGAALAVQSDLAISSFIISLVPP